MVNLSTRCFWQSAVIPYLLDKGKTRVVLITSSSLKNWVIPKGLIEPGMTPEDSAAKEAFEEAGVIGRVSKMQVAQYEYKKWGGICHVKVFPLEVTKVLVSWEEMDRRSRVFVDIPSAIKLAKSELKAVLENFQNLSSVQERSRTYRRKQ